jgi:hypothetical protein
LEGEGRFNDGRQERRRALERGMTKDECVATLTAMTDRYPMDVEQDGMAPRVMQMTSPTFTTI